MKPHDETSIKPDRARALPRTLRLLRQYALAAAAALLGAAATAAPGAGMPAPSAARPAFQVEVSGQGSPIILIPGLASPGAVWDGAVRRYCGTRQCHVLTLAGFAGVPAIEAPLLDSASKQLSDYIAANKLHKPVVVGHSLGGFLALKLAIAYPDQVGPLVIVDALPALGATQTPNLTAEQLQAMAAAMRDGMLQQEPAQFAAQQRRAIAAMATSPTDVERIVGWGKQSDRLSVIRAMHELMADDLRRQVARIQSPTLVLGSWIAYKEYAPRSAVEALYRSQYSALPGAQVELADTARHFIMVDDPDWLYARIDAFLQ